MKKPSTRRSLRMESLESRSLFAIDGMVPHNFLSPEDCDGSGDVSPLDALVVINELNRADSSRMRDAAKMLDVDADGLLTPLDALVVINHLNLERSAGTMLPSSVSKESRVLRLQAAIADGVLPPSMSLDDARGVLETLNSGGKPELGERWIDGHLFARADAEKMMTERAANRLIKPIHENVPPHQVEHFVEKFSERLKAAGIDGQAIGTIAREIVSGIESKQPLTLDQIKGRLTELGVDVSKLFPAVLPNTGRGNPAQPIRLPSIGLVTSVLQRLNVSRDTVDVVRKAMLAAKESGKPLSVSSVLALLTENGVKIPDHLIRIIGLA